MSGIVVVERSATLSHLLQRTLSAAQQSADRVLTHYHELDPLLEAFESGQQRYSVVVVGAPQRHGPEFEKALAGLMKGRAAQLAVLILSHEKTPFLSEWLAQRRNAMLLLWSNFGRIPAAVKQLQPPVPATPAQSSGNVAPAPARRGSHDHKFSPLKVLLVDDSQSVRYLYRQMLEENGFIVDTAASLQEGYTKGQTGAYDLAILDYYLPDGNGDELTRKLVEHLGARAMPIAIITGSYKDGIIKNCLEAGAVECMFKNEVMELTLARIKALARTIHVQKSVEAERQRLESILRSVGDGVYGVDNQGLITFVNPTAIRLLAQLSSQDLIGRNAHECFHFAAEDGERRSASEDTLARAYAEGTTIEGYETVFWTRAGLALPVECNVLPLTIQGRREGSVVVFRNISERKSAERLRWELLHDPVTGLANRRHLTQALSQEVERRRERGGYSALLFIDLDRFSTIVEACGQAAADRVLADVGQRLVQRLRQDDLLARLEDDHFALVLSNVQLENLFSIADSFRELVHETEYPLYGKKMALAASVGVAILSHDVPSTEYVLEHARIACREAKRRGRDQTQIYVASSDARIARELDAGWTVRLREALHEDRFVLYAQPIHAANPQAQGAESLYEILIRMSHRDGQLVSPSVFVPLAERVGMMPKIDMWVLSRALKHLAALPPESPVGFTINLSNATLQDHESLKLIEQLILGSGVRSSRIVFEVTETQEIDSLHSARRFIQALRKQGVRFALDDFGTGYSSLSHLKHLPVDFVKIEGSLVADLAESERDRSMIASMIGLVHGLKLKVIAEHVDSEANLSWLREVGADYLQGNYLGEAMRLDEIELTPRAA